ncbi:hypothetical protein QFC21_007250 [Naganishia friedmannii]|uniref:Uncharacterized protein n=1 Tax=Naganishia friedmannii TaxID=89922 RepID=A0ACC2UWU1_9TREE|nr:hypothetical protein QFC21_007250 [Naganishia friedmannii]
MDLSTDHSVPFSSVPIGPTDILSMGGTSHPHFKSVVPATSSVAPETHYKEPDHVAGFSNDATQYTYSISEAANHNVPASVDQEILDLPVLGPDERIRGDGGVALTPEEHLRRLMAKYAKEPQTGGKQDKGPDVHESQPNIKAEVGDDPV